MSKYILKINKNIGFKECDMIREYLDISKYNDQISLVFKDSNLNIIKSIIEDMNLKIINEKKTTLEKYEIIVNKIK